MTKLVRLAGWSTPRCSVIFVHGLGGHAYYTWREKASDSLWPLWLAQDVEGLDVFSLSYAAPIFNWIGTAMPLEDRAGNVLETLISYPELTAQPIVFVCHSLGGLVIKQVLREAADQCGHRPEAAKFLKAVRGVVFVATPHTGSPHASWIARLGFLLWPSATTLNLVANDPGLRNLNVWYRNWSPRSEIKHRVFYEMQSTAAGTIVAANSADPGLLNAPYVAVDADHVSITKLSSRDDVVYRVTRTFVNELVAASSPAAEDPANQFAEEPRQVIATQRSRNYGPIALRLALLAIVLFVGLNGVRAVLGGDVASELCRVPLLQPQISDSCGALGFGNRPTKTERLAWESRELGSCAALRTHIERFPQGAYHADAADMLASKRVIPMEIWTPSTRRLTLFVGEDDAASRDEVGARAAAMARGQVSVERLCKAFAATTLFRFTSAKPVAQTWHCSTAAKGVICGFEGEAVCAIEERRVQEDESCGG